MKLFQEHSMMKSNQEVKQGYIHSTESFGTVDGPGIRFVVFFQGCPMRCQYCHNPDTWEMGKGRKMTVEEIMSAYEKNTTFYRNGGITATGGEPLMQLPFLIRLFKEAKSRDIHTCLDTSGIVYRKERAEEFAELFKYVDLVLLDIKHSLAQGHVKLTGQDQKPVIAFADALEAAGIPMVIRHVAVPGITDKEEELTALGHLIGKYKNLKGLDVLPYHTMGVKKYEALGLSYPLEGTNSMTKEDAKKAREIVIKALKEVR